MKPRILTKTVKRAIKTFPAVIITGPRQSGKTTLLRNEFGQSHQFVSLENPNTRLLAKADPVGFLKQHAPPVIIDEIQYVPQLLSYIKTLIDDDRRPGQWLLTGSQNFVLMKGVTQSLAGRAAVLSLLPFSLAEQLDNAEHSLAIEQWLLCLATRKIDSHQTATLSLANWILRGNYPEIAINPSVERKLWCGSYITTYLERDVRSISAIGDLEQFERFLQMCAARTGQLLNMSELARDIGVNSSTVKNWLSILQASYQIQLLYPYYSNRNKRFIKQPKLYFTDTALATYLMGIHDEETLFGSSLFGQLFETAVVNDIQKRFLHFGDRPAQYFVRTRNGLEIDLAIETGKKLSLFEIKSTATITPQHAAALQRFSQSWKGEILQRTIIAQSPTTWLKNCTAYHWRDTLGM